MIVVADSSPLIAMGRIGQLEILHAVLGQLLVPDAVWKEVDVCPQSWLEGPDHRRGDGHIVR